MRRLTCRSDSFELWRWLGSPIEAFHRRFQAERFNSIDGYIDRNRQRSGSDRRLNATTAEPAGSACTFGFKLRFIFMSGFRANGPAICGGPIQGGQFQGALCSSLLVASGACNVDNPESEQRADAGRGTPQRHTT